MSLDRGRRAQPRKLGRASLGTAAIGAAVGSAVAYHSRYRAPFEPVLERVSFTGFATDAAMPPLRIGFVTDVHIGPAFRASDAERALNLIAAEKPDLFLLGGDYVCESPRFLNEAAAVLGAFVTQARYEALAVLGNHDYSNDAPRLTALLERVGIRVLRNEAACVPSETNPLWVAGIDDAVLGRPDLCTAFKPIGPSSQLRAGPLCSSPAIATADRCACPSSAPSPRRLAEDGSSPVTTTLKAWRSTRPAALASIGHRFDFAALRKSPS
jgi:predicted MPP superfamily phosphohydrolase